MIDVLTSIETMEKSILIESKIENINKNEKIIDDVSEDSPPLIGLSTDMLGISTDDDDIMGETILEGQSSDYLDYA